MIKAKKLEDCLKDILKGDDSELYHKYDSETINCSKKMAYNVLSHNKSGIKSVYKPKIRQKPYYGTKTEPKTDLRIEFNDGEVLKPSIKKDVTDAFIISSNSPDDVIRILLNPKYKYLLPQDLQERGLNVIHDSIGKEIDFEKYDSKYELVENFVDNRLSKKEILGIRSKKMLGASGVLQLRNSICELYLQNKGSYSKKEERILKERNVDEYIKEVLFHPKYAKQLIYEMITGSSKFPEDSDCVANCVLEPQGLHMIDSVDCKYIHNKIESLKNKNQTARVFDNPRYKILIEDVKSYLCGNISMDELAYSFAKRDLTFKM